jgi:hypothetical protein
MPAGMPHMPPFAEPGLPARAEDASRRGVGMVPRQQSV